MCIRDRFSVSVMFLITVAVVDVPMAISVTTIFAVIIVVMMIFVVIVVHVYKPSKMPGWLLAAVRQSMVTRGSEAGKVCLSARVS